MSHMPTPNDPGRPRQGDFFDVTDFGARGNGEADNYAVLQRAIDATPGKVLLFPKGKYKVSQTLIISDRMHRLVGEFGGRYADGGTEIVFTGTGPCIQIGSDDDVDWDANHYGGDDPEQDQQFENLWISHASPDSTLDSAPTAGPHYKAGSYGIWDWYGGGVRLKGVGIEKFEANFVGIQSDISSLEEVTSLYSKYGVYLGPRSDQVTISRLYSFYCERAVTIDRAVHTRIVDAQIVDCGNATTAPIEIRRGSASTRIERGWFEHLDGYSGTDQLAFVSAGEVNGYSAGGDLSGTGSTNSPCEGVTVDNPLVYTPAAGVASHTKHLVSAGKCRRLVVHAPVMPSGSTIANFDALVGIQASQSPTNTDTQIEIDGVNSDLAVSKFFSNAGGGDPSVWIRAQGATGNMVYGDNNGRFFVRRTDGDVLKGLFLSSENNVGGVSIAMPTNPSSWAAATTYSVDTIVRANNKFYKCTVAGTSSSTAPSHTSGTATDGSVTWSFQATSRQQTRLGLLRALRQSSAVPSSGDWETGDVVIHSSPSAGSPALWRCITTGTPGTWEQLDVPLRGSVSWTPAITNSTSGSTTLTVTGAAVGDVVAVGFSQAVPAGVLLSGAVSAANTVRVTAMNHSGSDWNSSAGTLTARVWKA